MKITWRLASGLAFWRSAGASSGRLRRGDWRLAMGLLWMRHRVGGLSRGCERTLVTCKHKDGLKGGGTHESPSPSTNSGLENTQMLDSLPRNAVVSLAVGKGVVLFLESSPRASKCCCWWWDGDQLWSVCLAFRSWEIHLGVPLPVKVPYILCTELHAELTTSRAAPPLPHTSSRRRPGNNSCFNLQAPRA
jgi:hypothetical protein